MGLFIYPSPLSIYVEQKTWLVNAKADGEIYHPLHIHIQYLNIDSFILSHAMNI
jgi:hypothetical protein